MKVAFIVIMATILLVSSMSMGGVQGNGNGQIQFETGPAFNLTIGAQKISINLFSPQYLSSNQNKIFKNQDMNLSDVAGSLYGQNDLHFSKFVKESFHRKINGRLNVSYQYFVEESVFKINMQNSPLILQNTTLSTTHGFLFINMTINICELKSNKTIVGQSGNIFVGSNNSLRITYNLDVHSTLGGAYQIVVPTVFSSNSTGIGVKNFTNARTDDRNEDYDGVNFHIGGNKDIFFVYNRTYYANGEPKEMNPLNFGPQGKNLNVLAYVFNGTGKYSNISYDPYLSIPGQNILKNITVNNIESGFMRLILQNSVYLSIGLFVGTGVIGSGYFYRRRK
ncbi:MAG: hypothetical protein M1597_02445 [Candidatus Thermoplasmatota archaeon]|nr:hypothetical protein [Candidatus Thermoplasmatota archaeon]